MTDKLWNRFWKYAEKGRGCWAWCGSKGRDGYGVIGLYLEVDRARIGSSRNARAHRVAWSLSRDVRVPKDSVIMHTCDNPGCVRPSHLRLGTVKDNHDDMHAKGRARVGENGGRAKLSRSDVVRIRRMYDLGDTASSLSRQFGVSLTLVRMILLGEAWSHAGGPIRSSLERRQPSVAGKRNPNYKHGRFTRTATS